MPLNDHIKRKLKMTTKRDLGDLLVVIYTDVREVNVANFKITEIRTLQGDAGVNESYIITGKVLRSKSGSLDLELVTLTVNDDQINADSDIPPVLTDIYPCFHVGPNGELDFAPDLVRVYDTPVPGITLEKTIGAINRALITQKIT